MRLQATEPAGPSAAKHQRLAVICTHPIQYYAPWFRDLAAQDDLSVRVFFLFQPAVEGAFDVGFQQEVRWDMPLLDGYEHEFVPNVSSAPGTQRFWGLQNPELAGRVRAFRPGAVLMIGYNYASMIRFILTWPTSTAPLILRGDSHRLVQDVSWQARLKRTLLTILFRRFSAFLYVGAANLRYFKLHGVPDQALFHAPHAVDIARFTANAGEARAAARSWLRELGIDDQRAVVLFAGKFESKKRPLDLLRAFRASRHGDAALLFVGSGELEGQLREEARRDRNVYFAPFQNQSRMPRTYAACDVLVLPSFGPHETWGLAINEAMCLGKPAIVSSHVGCAEDLVLHEKTGLVFEAGDVSALTQALSDALQNREQLRTWGEAARERVRMFSYAEATSGLVQALANMGSNHHA